MQRKRVTIVATLAMCLFVLFVGAAIAAADDDVRGMIISRTGQTLIVSSAGTRTTVVLTASTRVKDDKGLFGLAKEEMADTVLIPGLKVVVDGSSDSQGLFVAETITVDGDDLETSEMIQSGLHPTAEQVAANVAAIETHEQKITQSQQDIAANQQAIAAHKEAIAEHTQKIDQNIKDIQENTDRFNRLDDYNVKGEASVKFKAGSSIISKEDKEQLKTLAETALALAGYIIEVKGFADSTGSSVMNEKLSEDRAKTVVGYLMRECNVPVWRIVAPGAMGEFQPAASNETSAGRAENRRVEVKILVNKGIAGAQQASAQP
jgi:outer membrane protein OmpA-like peptidoglycan-associated protein